MTCSDYAEFRSREDWEDYRRVHNLPLTIGVKTRITNSAGTFFDFDGCISSSGWQHARLRLL